MEKNMQVKTNKNNKIPTILKRTHLLDKINNVKLYILFKIHRNNNQRTKFYCISIFTEKKYNCYGLVQIHGKMTEQKRHNISSLS